MSVQPNLQTEIEDILGRQGLLAEEPVEVSEGEVKETHVYGDDLVVQHVEQDTDRFSRGARMYKVLENTSIPVPEVVGFQQNPHILSTEFVDGETPETENQYRAVGQKLAEIHQEFSPENYGKLDYENPDLETGGEFTDWQDFLRTDLNSRIRSLGELHDVGLEMDVREAFNSYVGDISGQPPSSLLHYDFDFNEVAMQGDEVQAIFDWDEAVAGDPDYEFVVTRDSIEDAQKRKSFTEGYREVKNTRVSDSKENAYLIHDAVGKSPYFNMLNFKGDLSDGEIESQREHLEDLCEGYLN